MIQIYKNKHTQLNTSFTEFMDMWTDPKPRSKDAEDWVQEACLKLSQFHNCIVSEPVLLVFALF